MGPPPPPNHAPPSTTNTAPVIYELKSLATFEECVKSEGAGGNVTSSIKNMVGADRELDVLSRVLQGFDASADDNQ